MTVKELVALLQTFPQDLEVIRTRYSDYGFMEPSEVSVVKAVDKQGNEWTDSEGHWLMRAHSTMSDEDKMLTKDYLHFQGN